MTAARDRQHARGVRSPHDVFFLLAQSRSGSTWLEQTLNAHPDVCCVHEPSNIYRRRLFRWPMLVATTAGDVLGYRELADDIAARLPLRQEYHLERLERELQLPDKRLTGAKIVLPQLITHFDFTDFFIRYRQARFILLDRASAADALCSFMVARRTRIWNSATHRHETLEPFTISRDHAEAYMLSTLLYQKLVLTYFHSLRIRFIELNYEQLMGDTTATLALVAEFLGASEFRDYSQLQKLAVRPYSTIITNYEELIELEALLKRQISV